MCRIFALTRSMSASVKSMALPRLLIPTPLNRISASTPVAHIFPKQLRTCCEFPISHSNDENLRPSALMSCSNDGSAGSAGSCTETISQPASARVRHSSLPMPPVEPVQIAVFPRNENNSLTGSRSGQAAIPLRTYSDCVIMKICVGWVFVVLKRIVQRLWNAVPEEPPMEHRLLKTTTR